jgi:hypothetical protein
MAILISTPFRVLKVDRLSLTMSSISKYQKVVNNARGTHVISKCGNKGNISGCEGKRRASISEVIQITKL